MAKTLDFTKMKKEPLTVVLDDGNDTKLRVKTPTKSLGLRIDNITKVDENANVEDIYNEVYGVCAEILSNNIEGKRIDPSKIEQCMGIAECWTLINVYREYIVETMAANAKN